MILSVGAIGCNLTCFFCQNWQIAHPKDSMHERPPAVVEAMTEPLGVDELVAQAVRFKPNGNIGVAFTYNEPFIWFEYVLDAARALHDAGLKVVLVTNGYVNEAPLLELLPYVDAMNIDIKAFSDEFYKKIGGRREAVMRTAKLARDKCHIELTNLLIPGLNTSSAEISALVDWVADSLGPSTPLHFSRYFPARRSTVEATAIADMENAYRIATKRLQNVVLGNI
jgi:pyruvate formate lyase activating enzyme